MHIRVSVIKAVHKENSGKKSFLQNEGGNRDGLKNQKVRNEGSLHSKDAQSCMTPSVYLCVIVHKRREHASLVTVRLVDREIKKIDWSFKQRWRHVALCIFAVK